MTHTPPSLSKPVIVIVRIIWLALAGFLLVGFGLSVAFRLALHQNPAAAALLMPLNQAFGLGPEVLPIAVFILSPTEIAQLPILGLSLQSYALYIIGWDVALALTCSAAGMLIMWRRADNWLAVWIALFLLLLGTAGGMAPTIGLLAGEWVGWGWVSTLGGIAGMISIVHVMLLSPNGRFVPAWTGILAAACTGFMGAVALFLLDIPIPRYSATIFLAAPVWLVGLLVGMGAQVYRYRYISSPVERQQSKWAAIGLIGASAGFLVNGVALAFAVQPGITRVYANLLRAPLVTICFLFMPICLIFAILRYRLWDIDVLIRRTLTYSLFTGILTLIYFGIIVILQTVFERISGEGQNQFVTVVSTLTIAPCFFRCAAALNASSTGAFTATNTMRPKHSPNLRQQRGMRRTWTSLRHNWWKWCKSRCGRST